MKVNEGKCHVLPLEWNNPCASVARDGAVQLESGLGRKGLGCAGGHQVEHEPLVEHRMQTVSRAASLAGQGR